MIDWVKWILNNEGIYLSEQCYPLFDTVGYCQQYIFSDGVKNYTVLLAADAISKKVIESFKSAHSNETLCCIYKGEYRGKPVCLFEFPMKIYTKTIYKKGFRVSLVKCNDRYKSFPYDYKAIGSINYSVKVSTEDFVQDNIHANISNNRFDLYEKDFEYVTLEYADTKYAIEYIITNGNCIPGIFLSDIPYLVMKSFVRYVFLHGAKKVTYENVPWGEGVCRIVTQRMLDLPDTYDNLLKRITSKHRYNVRRQRRILDESGVEYGECNSTEEIDNTCNDFIKTKNQYIKKNIALTGEQYRLRWDIDYANFYKLDDEFVGGVLAASKGKIVNLVNLVYDDRLAKYSLGNDAYVRFLEEMINRNKTAIYLGGDKQDYKKHFDSYTISLWQGVIYKSRLKSLFFTFVHRVKDLLKAIW